MALTPGQQRYFADEQAIRDAYWTVAAGDVVIDIGAALGSYSIPALEVGAEVVAIDSDAASLRTFDQLCMERGFARWTSLDYAIGQPYDPELYEAIPDYLRPPADAEWRTLDWVAADLGLTRCDWIKIDVEGGELGVLQSAMVLLEAHQPRLLIEDHARVYPWVGRNSAPMAALLLDLGYQHEVVPYDGADGSRDYWVCHA